MYSMVPWIPWATGDKLVPRPRMAEATARRTRKMIDRSVVLKRLVQNVAAERELLLPRDLLELLTPHNHMVDDLSVDNLVLLPVPVTRMQPSIVGRYEGIALLTRGQWPKCIYGCSQL
jgi:hypothetical protein